MAETSRFLPWPLVRLVVMQSVMNASHFMAMPLLAIHAVDNLRLSRTDVGTMLFAYFVCARVLPLVLAPLADRYGRWLALTAGLVLRSIGFLGFALQPGAAGAIALTACLGVGTSLYEAGAYGVIGSQERSVRERLIVVNAQGLNVGVVLGPLVGVLVAQGGTLAPILLSGVVFAVLTGAAIAERSPLVRSQAKTPFIANLRDVLGDGPYLLLCGSLVPWFVLFAQLFSSLPLEAADRGGAASWASLVILAKGASGLLALFAIPWMTRALGWRRMMVSCVALGAGSLGLVPLTSNATAILAIVAVYSVAEVGVLIIAEMIISQRSDQRSTSTYFAVFFASWGVGGALGGLLGPYLQHQYWGFQWGWPMMGCSCVLTIWGIQLYFLRTGTPSNSDRGV